MSKVPNVLVAPLDWGLGHATRCVPVIQVLLRKRARVSVAGSGSALALLKSEFPSLPFHELPGYQVKYASGGGLMLNVFKQLPRFLRVIWQEHHALETIVRNEGFDIVISDNRFGCWTRKAKTVFITHQVHILMPSVIKWLEPVINYFNRRFIKRFDQCWVPDLPGSVYTGRLSLRNMAGIRYVGTLSRFSPQGQQSSKKFQCLGIVSGPEPQRAIFEKKIRQEFQKLQKPCAIVKGIPRSDANWSHHGDIFEIDHLPANEMQKLIERSEWIISRSGYSTIMDLIAVGGRAIFVPTPGQTEQVYLAKKLEEGGVAFFQFQEDLNLSFALSKSLEHAGFEVTPQQPNLLNDAVDELIHELD